MKHCDCIKYKRQIKELQQLVKEQAIAIGFLKSLLQVTGGITIEDNSNN